MLEISLLTLEGLCVSLGEQDVRGVFFFTDFSLFEYHARPHHWNEVCERR